MIMFTQEQIDDFLNGKIKYRSIDPKEKGMNEHVNETEGAVAPLLDVVEHPAGLDTVVGAEEPIFVQDDSDYPIDPLDDFPEINAFGSASALDKAEGKVRQDEDD